MIKITQLKLPIGHSKEQLRQKVIKLLKLNHKQEFTYDIIKRSIDARKKPELFYIYTLAVFMAKEDAVLKRIHNPSISVAKQESYRYPKAGEQQLTKSPIIVGAGPAGLFCAYLLTECGFSPVIIERGAPIEERIKDVSRFWETGQLNTQSNVQFGEGGAGTFSDGKLNSAVHDKYCRNEFVLDTFIRFGAPEEIRYDNKPHIGTDILAKIIVNMRHYLIEKGCTFQFHTCANDFLIKNGQLSGVICNNTTYDTQVVVLALGHSARDTFRRLNELNIPMQAKNFAVGFRVEHPQKMINEAMYGIQKNQNLPAAPYKLTSNFPNGRGVYSFCMCPGGYVVNASSEHEKLVVNGMSYSGRDSNNANSAIIVSVGTDDFGATDALSGMRYQEELEQKAFLLAKGRIPQQLYGDYCKGQLSSDYGDFITTTKGACSFANLRGLFSDEIEKSFIMGMEHFSKIIPKYNRFDAILSGVEARTSSPIRILRNEFMESEIKGIYPCGEGAGYAGGIMSAAMDGMKVAEVIIQKFKPI